MFASSSVERPRSSSASVCDAAATSACSLPPRTTRIAIRRKKFVLMANSGRRNEFFVYEFLDEKNMRKSGSVTLE
jgi:hypothetical protein